MGLTLPLPLNADVESQCVKLNACRPSKALHFLIPNYLAKFVKLVQYL